MIKGTAGFILALYQALSGCQSSTPSRADVDAQAWYTSRYENSRV